MKINMNSSVVNIIIIVVAAVVLFIVLKYLNNRNSGLIPNVPIKHKEFMENAPVGEVEESSEGEVQGVDETNMVNNVPQGDMQREDSLRAEDLLPKQSQESQDFASANPSGAGNLSNVSVLTATSKIGINTVGQTLRNANYQLRSDPPNPQTKVSPWLQTTIEADTNRKVFEIGCAC